MPPVQAYIFTFIVALCIAGPSALQGWFLQRQAAGKRRQQVGFRKCLWYTSLVPDH